MPIDTRQRTPKYGVTITTVDRTTNTIQGVLKTGGAANITIVTTPIAFRWPVVGESWMVRQENGAWYLDSPWPNSDPNTTANYGLPGDIVLNSNTGWVDVIGSPDGSQDFRFNKNSFHGGGPPLGPAGGDLFGTYPDPGVAAIDHVFKEGPQPTAGEVLTATSSSTMEWSPPAPTTPIGPAGGDLFGTYPDPGVAAVDHVFVEGGPPTPGEVLTATSTSTMEWLPAPSTVFTRQSATTTFTGLTTSTETLGNYTLIGQACLLYYVVVDQPCRVRVYATAAQAAADISRTEYIDPGVDAGCLMELVYIAPGSLVLSPAIMLVEQDSGPSSVFPGVIRCDSGTTVNVTVFGYVLQA